MAIFSAIGAAIFGAGTFFAGATAFGLQMAAGIGLSYAAQAIAGKKKVTPNSVSHFSTQGTIQASGEIPRTFILGKYATPGSLVYANTWGNVNQTPNAYFTQVIAISDLPCASLDQLWVNGEPVTLAGSEEGLLGRPVTQYAKNGNNHLWVKFYDGTQVSADPLLTSSVASAERPWGVDRIGKGVCYAVVTALVDDTLFTGFPSFKFAVSGFKLYDPSKDSTVGGSGSHRYSDPSTWGGDGDHIPAVQIYNIMRGFYYENEWLYGPQNMTAARLPSLNWIAQINKCRELVNGPSGQEYSYRSGCQISVNSQSADAVEMLLTACQGKMSEIGGFYKLKIGAPDSPVAFFTDDDILSTEEQSFTPFYGLSESINGVNGRHPSPEEAWNTVVAPPLYNDDFELEDGNRRLLADVNFEAVPYPSQVQRLMLSALQEARRARRHTYSLPPQFWILEPGETVEWNSERNGYTNKLFRIDGMVDKANLDVLCDLTEVDPEDFDWDQDEDYTPPVNAPVVIVRPPPQPMVDWFAEPWNILDDDGFERRPAIRLAWNGAQPDVARTQFEVRNDFGDKEVIYRGNTENVAAGEIIIAQNLVPNTDYEVRGRYVPANPRDTEWSDWIEVTTPNTLLTERDFEGTLEAKVDQAFIDAIEDIDKTSQLIASVSTEQDAANYLDKAMHRSVMEARSGSLTASIEEVRTVAVDNEAAFAEYQLVINAAVGDLEASVEVNATAVATINGKLAAAYGVTLDVNGYASGFKQLNDGTTSSFVISADVFQVAFPGGVSGGSPVPVFQIANVNGTAKIAIRGDMFFDGSITATKLNVSQLSAITANLGTITSGLITSTDGKFVIDLDNQRILIYD